MTMTELSPAASEWLAKTAGAFAGAAISLAWLLPRSRREAALRFLGSVTAGLVFGGTAGLAAAQRLGIAAMLSPHEMLLAGSALASAKLAELGKANFITFSGGASYSTKRGYEARLVKITDSLHAALTEE